MDKTELRQPQRCGFERICVDKSRFERRTIFVRHSIFLRLRPPKKWYDLGLSEIDSRVFMSFFKFIPCTAEDLKWKVATILSY